jgi:hypothetical protein
VSPGRQLDWLGEPAPDFNGATYEREHDRERLANQLERVRTATGDGRWRTLQEISRLARAPPASVSAQLRHLRKERFGAHTVEKRIRGERADGLYEYRVRRE